MRWQRAPIRRLLYPIAAALLGVVLAAATAHAHGAGSSQLHLRVDDARLAGTWELDLHDARLALGLDPHLEGEAGYRDLLRNEAELRAYLTGRLVMLSDSLACAITLPPDSMEWRPSQGVVRLHVAASCPVAPRRLTLGSDILFDLDPRHRAYFSVEDARAISAGLFRMDLRSATFDIRHLEIREVLIEFLRDGVWKMLSGLAHVLFVVALLLPAVLERDGAGWSPRAGFGAGAREALKVMVAFALAHSITLALAFFGVVTLPSRWIGVAIALSVFAASWNNLRPFLPGRGWALALAFGLAHGLGLAGTLRNLPLPRRAQGLALGAFNAGVELGLIALVAVALPVLYGASRKPWYPRVAMGAGSLAIAWVAAVWAIERGFGFSLVPAR